MRDITLEETVYFFFTTRAFGTGVPTTLTSGVLSVLESNNITPMTSGVTVIVDRASVTGMNQATIAATNGNGFEAGKSYAVYISTGTVGGVSVIGEVVAEFTVQASAAFTRLGAPVAASISADIAGVQADTDNIQTRIPAALGANGNMKSDIRDYAGTAGLFSLGAMPDVNVSYIATRQAFATVGGVTFPNGTLANTTNITAGTITTATNVTTVNGLAADVITAAATAPDFTTEVTAGLSTLTAAGVRTAVGLAAANLDTQLTTIDDFLDTEVAAIKAKTDLIPAAPAAVGDIPTAVQNADALLDRNMATGTDSGSPTVRTLRQAIRFLRNKWSVAGTTLTVMKEDDATASWTSTVTATPGADPITGNDPA